MPDFDVFSLLDIRMRNRRSRGKRKNGNLKRKHKNKTFWTLTDLWKILKSGRHQLLSKLFHLVLLPFVNWMKKLINSMIENLTSIIHFSYSMLHSTCSSTIDSEMNHIRHFIKIPFINKGIDFIDVPSLFRDNTVESSIPDYFENKEPPIICYKYNKPIRSTIFNFNKLVAKFMMH